MTPFWQSVLIYLACLLLNSLVAFAAGWWLALYVKLRFTDRKILRMIQQILEDSIVPDDEEEFVALTPAPREEG